MGDDENGKRFESLAMPDLDAAYWQARGRTFRDHDSYHVVLERSAWPDR